MNSSVGNFILILIGVVVIPTVTPATLQLVSKVPAVQTVGNSSLELSCFDEFGQAYVGNLPHPTDCNKYILCQYLGGGEYFPNEISCGADVLTYDFDECVCDFTGEPSVECYDSENEDHVAEQFICATAHP